MFTTIEIIILTALFITQFIISNTQLYFTTIYLFILIYNAFILYKFIRINCDVFNMDLIKYFFMSIILYIISYSIIYTINPLYYLFTFYLPFQNFFKGIFIIIFHTYYLNKYTLHKKEGYEKIPDSTNVVIIRVSKTSGFSNIRFDFFLSKLINYFKKNKKFFFLFITCLIFIQIICFFYRTKFWIYFNSKEKVLPLSTSKNTTYYITACVYKMEPIIVDFITEMKKVINYLGERNIIVSIVENGDSPDNTKYYLVEFQNYLNEKNIPNKFILDKQIEDPRKNATTNEDKQYKRIKYLTDLRNLCFKFLYELPNLDFDNTRVINFNDIVYSYEDVIKLLSTNNEEYDAVCAMDFYFNFYDTWVSIDLDGNGLRETFPYFINREAQEQVINKKPIRVFSCWNGVIAFNASVFKDKKIKFRYEKINKNLTHKFNTYKYLMGMGYESECTLFNIDLQSYGFNKRFINSDIRVSYHKSDYYFCKYILPNTFEIIFYFGNFFKSFKEKRNKLMSEMNAKNVTFSERLYYSYLTHNKNLTI